MESGGGIVVEQGRQLNQAVLESFNRLVDERGLTYQATLHNGQPVKKILIDENTRVLVDELRNRTPDVECS